MKLSLIIPLYNEAKTINFLIDSILQQTRMPDEVILVDGGSADNTVSLIKQFTINDGRFRVIEAGRAMPGRGRNIGAENANYDWIVFTDAGIKLDAHWIEKLIEKKESDPGAAVIYGNYSPQVTNFFEKCAAIAYVPPLKPGAIRTKFIASCLLKKEVWEKVGGFPDWRAAEDLIFMDKAEEMGFKSAIAPEAMVYWQLRQDIGSTYKKFELYSMHNVWAGMQVHWHYSIAKQYAVMLIFLALAIFQSWYWILLLPAWLIARAAKRIISYKYEYGLKTLLNPAIYFMVIIITVVIDAATFSGWLKAIFSKPGVNIAVH